MDPATLFIAPPPSTGSDMSDVRSTQREELPRVYVDVATQPLALPAPPVSYPNAVEEADCNVVDCSQCSPAPTALALPPGPDPRPVAVANMQHNVQNFHAVHTVQHVHVAPTDTAALFAGVRQMTGSIDERVSTLVGHLMDKFRDVDAAVALNTERVQQLPSAVLQRIEALEAGQQELHTLLSQHQQQLADRIDEVVARVASVEDIAVQARVQSASSQSNTTALACRVRSAETRM